MSTIIKIKEKCTMKKYEDIINECEKQSVPDREIDCSEIPPITDFSGFHFGNENYCSTKNRFPSD